MIRTTIAKAILALNRKLKGIWKQYFLMPYWKEAFKSIGENVYIGDKGNKLILEFHIAVCHKKSNNKKRQDFSCSS